MARHHDVTRTPRARTSAAALVGGLLLLASPARAEQPVPARTGPVVDLAGLLDPGSVAEISAALCRIRDTWGGQGPQVQLLVVGGLSGEPIERFAGRVAADWRIGDGGRQHGVLIVVARADRLVRIRTNTLARSRLTDEEAARIVEGLTSAFRAGRYAPALLGAVRQIGATLGVSTELESTAAVAPPPAPRAATTPAAGPLVILFVVAVVAIVALIVWTMKGAMPAASRSDDAGDARRGAQPTAGLEGGDMLILHAALSSPVQSTPRPSDGEGWTGGGGSEAGGSFDGGGGATGSW